MSKFRTVRPQLALEVTMREILNNMEELVSDLPVHEMGGEFELVAIERMNRPSQTGHKPDPRPQTRHIFSASIYQFASRNNKAA